MAKANWANSSGGSDNETMEADELRERFPKLTLQATQLSTGQWIVASSTKPLTEDEATKVVVAYQTIQELVARGSGR